ncbi:MAG: hypothetical protein A3G49_05655 [Candidatus Sungbacteria bacterium RIFCSPLOWO2_12_FULL_41_11]|uniref:Uncharacterized protein n=1 Tax=Candidatus Sungbacteria bacterium RIFCSPLOWO2_12_FULL_41_11 TaxID=1802286 RepID=A0A1G2LUR6_9BACT|nr:MAG: hypothetical protein UV01_C0008G0024 [Parcubacteria group bacterium GW2011_GWA2_42_14]OGZ99208.1 MAG: hypothetical protein A3D41_02815 [Candidatus Sungbacteria bacterium RIFCSPHIGHO2_02_FULL_41_12b]OHA14639.1 MAG: hypothetical protein A3G49_05655 [Candidatus Sungbacteria bacterium RIFCSPLOWO2_12_FULL_41_11]
MESRHKRLEITFSESLQEGPSGINPGGVVFPPEVITAYDLKTNKIVLREDFTVWQNLQDKVFLFESHAPHTPKILVHAKKILSIREVGGAVLYTA